MYAVDEQDDIVTVVAIVGADADPTDQLEGVLARIVDVDKRVAERGASVASEAAPIAERMGGREDVVLPRGNSFCPEFAFSDHERFGDR